MTNELLLLSKNDIPFIEGQVNIHQPTIKEISLIGEEDFHIACQFLALNKNQLSTSDKTLLGNQSDFDIIMSIIHMPESKKYKQVLQSLFMLLFPGYELKFQRFGFMLTNNETHHRVIIDNQNFEPFKKNIIEMFALQDIVNAEYNPADGIANKIAEKFRKRHQILSQQKGQSGEAKVAILSRYVSILAVGCQKDMNVLMDYTVYQLKDEFKRYQLKSNFDIYLKAKLAGAKDLEEVDNWMDDIHP